MSEVNTLTIPEEEDIVARAMRDWKSRKIQVLIDDDDVPENAHYLPLEKLVDFFDEHDIPVAIFIDGEHYKIRLRRHLSYAQYRWLVGELEKIAGEVSWDRENKMLIVRRYSLPESEVPEVPVIQPGKGVVGTMHGGGVE
ncbi:hypothetical protein [Thermococcus barophilus]|uniref:Uncharacterized protein n=1 Tax=Thermococcus barophilus TaxID=55802 RepID=A0A0S1XAQ0_THEBA|nr:hypothetical protein [Thermococcus barophilus]ALM74867.1 hypothetical protein TBCH5v1_0918 [Thermococcus barophilus]